MVYMQSFEDGDLFLSVSLGVGQGRANNRDDVTLVQHMLNLWLQHPTSAAVKRRAGTAGRPLTTDGLIGPKTKAQILAFQKWVVSVGETMVCDSCVDRVRGASFHNRGLYAVYCLHRMVVLYHGIAVHEMCNDPDFPARLKPIAMTERNRLQAAGA